jgi:outer membrane immunogenic protein
VADPHAKGIDQMKKHLLSAVTFAALAMGPALAADLPRKAPPAALPPPPPPLTWTGWYVGLNAGGHWSNNNDTDIVSAATSGGGCSLGFPCIQDFAAQGATLNLSNGNNAGFIGGGQIGYNWQFTGWVTGIEADIQGITNSSNDNTVITSVIANNGLPIITTVDASKRVSWLGTLRGRLGWLATPTFLIYGTGGLAYGGVKSNVNISQSHEVFLALDTTFGATAASFSDTRAGWTAGGGFEWMFAPRWSAKVEYLYYDLGDESFTAPQLSAAFNNGTGFVRYGITPQISTRFTGNIARVGVNYHF